MIEAYTRLHEQGHAHSVESWRDGELAGGLYGMALGKVFFGESMFARATDASKVALVRLVERLRARDYRVIDCQQATGHLASLGARRSRGIVRAGGSPRPTHRWSRESIQYPPSGERWTEDMAKLNDLPIANLQFYATAPYPCSYLPGKLARSQVATPSYLIDTDTYSALVSAAFAQRRFHLPALLRPCHACVPVRVVAAEFEPNRAQRRALARHAPSSRATASSSSTPSTTRSTRLYQSERHRGGGMDHDSREQYAHFLLQSNVATR
jgi:hypothetical protein